MVILKKIVIVVISAVLLSGLAVAQVQTPPPYPTQFWINGVLDNSVAQLTALELTGYKVIFYKTTNLNNPTNYEDGYAFALTLGPDGRFRINAHDSLKLAPLTAAPYYIGVVARNSIGVNQKDLAISAADLANGYKNVDPTLLTLKLGEGIPDIGGGLVIKDIAYGPQIKPSVLYQAMTNITDFSHSHVVYARIEARKLADGTAPAGQAGAATKLIGYADIILNENGNTIGRNGFLDKDGNEFGALTPMADGDYYLAVKQLLTANLVGIGHMSVISSRPIHLATVSGNRDASTTRIDFTNDSTVTENIANKIFKDTPYKPVPTKPDALFTLPGGSNRTVMRAGNMDGNNYIDVIDTSHWFRLFTRYNLPAPGNADDPNDPYIRSDLDQNGIIDVIDASWWFGSFKNLSYDLNDPGPHGYVPPLP